ncbi:proteasome stabiliser domain-containing protein [Sarocladium implicatum]|nr:proteasome stabiliser domain-containing protein [Sarocladium implicatum]
MATPSPEQRKLQLVEKLEFRILGVANQEKKLHDLLQVYLVPLILEVASEYAAVRTRVIQVLGRLKTFIQPPSIILPVSKLLDQYKSADSPLARQLDLSFIQHSLERIDDDDRRDLLPKAMAGCAANKSSPSGSAFLLVIFRLLLDARIPPRGSKEDETFRVSLGLENESDAIYLAEMISIFLRLKLPTATQDWRQSNPSLTSSELALFSVENPKNLKIFQRMSELKNKLVALLASGAFTDDEKFLPALYGSSSFDGRVSSSAEEIIKRSSVSLEDKELVLKLFAAHAKLPAAYRTRILNMLSKSSTSTTMSEQILAVVRLDFMEEESEVAVAQGLAPSSTLERTKLHKALFQYISWVARIGPSKEGFSIGPQLIDVMKSYIESQGWPQPQAASHDDVGLRSRAYETIGMLARSADMPISKRLDLAQWLFRSLSEDPINDAVVNIDGALSSLTANVSPDVGGQEITLRSMLLTYMSLPDDPPAVRSTRHAVVKWANQCLPLSDIYGRWVDILAIKGQPTERNDVVEQGHKGLDPWSYFVHLEGQPELPDWKAMVDTFFGRAITPTTTSKDSAASDPSSEQPFSNFHGSRLAAFPVALQYCKQMMFLSALSDFKIEPSWMQTLDALAKTDIKTREQIRVYLRSVDQAVLVFYLKCCLAGAFQEDSPIVEDCIRCFVEVAALCPTEVIGHLTTQSASLLGLVKSNDKEKRSLAAKALGIIAAHPKNSSDSILNWIQTLNALSTNAPEAIGPDLNVAEGALVAQGYLCSRAIYYGRDRLGDSDASYPLKLLVANGLFPTLQDAVSEAFAQLWSARLAVPPASGPAELSEVIQKLDVLAKKGNEKSIQALGRLAVAVQDEGGPGADEPLDSERWGTVGTILAKLFALHEIKQVEVHFTVGEAITAAIARWDSDSVKLTLDVESEGKAYALGARTTLIDSVLSKLFKDCKATKPSLLKASGIWLFSIVQYCSHLEQVQTRLREAQAAFMRLLSARDELVQETASRGLSLVYERGDEELKSALVKDLVSAFTGTATQLKVEEDTELFEPGALPTGEGSSVTSYKDIVNLANEVGDQRLVYKFMSLAANAATWSTRSAFGRFGLSNILGDSEVDPKLYPKLFRYRFDPNTNVQRSMDDIWKALVKDPTAVIDTHFDAIIEDLLKSILGREWRMREASCAAISDLLQGRPYAQYEKHYRDIWTAALKVLDDVKGSVREAALKLCMTLSNGLVRQLEESNNVAAAKAMMQEALPFLLSDKGVESSVEDVQVFATITVLKIAKQGGKSLKPFIPDMVTQLLGLLSTIEPQQINYQYQRAGEDSRDKIDRLRSQMVNRSPISEAIENAIRFVDAEVMAELAPRLEKTIKTAIGMPTKIGCSRVLTALFTRHAQDMEQASARFLQLMEKQTMDKNDEVSQAYARASAYMIRAVPEPAKDRFFKRLQDLYFNAEEEARRQKVSDVIVAVSKVSSDHFTAYQTQLLPFAYLGSHDTDDYTGKMFKEVWEQQAGSARTVARYVPEIASLVERCLDTAQWALRHAGAFTVGAMAADVAGASTATAQISEANLKVIWPIFDKALAMKTFAGKEKLLDPFPTFVEKAQALWKADEKVAAQMKKVALREAKRNNEDYRVHAFKALWKFAKARSDLDLQQDIFDIVSPHLDELKDESGDKMDVDSKEDLVGKTAKNGFEAVARGYNRQRMSDGPNATLLEVLKLLKPYLTNDKFSQIKREVWYTCVKDMVADAKSKDTPTAGSNSNVALELLKSLDMEQAEAGIESHRIQRAEAALGIIRAAASGPLDLGVNKSEAEDMVRAALGSERSQDVQKVWKQCLEHL